MSGKLQRPHFSRKKRAREMGHPGSIVANSVEMERDLNGDLYGDRFAVEHCGLELPTFHGLDCLLVEILAHALQYVNVTCAAVRFHIHA